MQKQAEKCARSLRNLDRSAGDDECLDYATSVFSIRHNSACRTRACLLCPHPVSICKFRFYFLQKFGLGTPSEIGNIAKTEFGVATGFWKKVKDRK
jgi:hypothetical protein